MIKTKKQIIIFLILSFSFVSISVSAATNYNPPGMGTNTDDPASFINALFNFGIGIAAILAVLMIVVGGFIYMVSQGNQATITKAKDFITGALLGLLLLLSSYILLKTIDPDLLNLDINTSGINQGGGQNTAPNEPIQDNEDNYRPELPFL